MDRAFPAADLAQDPRARNHGMGLEEFHARTGFHLGRNHAEQVLFHVNLVHCCYPVSFHYEFQVTGITQVAAALPVEIHPYGHSIEGKAAGIKLKRAELTPLVTDTAVFPTDLPPGGSVLRQAELYLAAGHNAYS